MALESKQELGKTFKQALDIRSSSGVDAIIGFWKENRQSVSYNGGPEYVRALDVLMMSKLGAALGMDVNTLGKVYGLIDPTDNSSTPDKNEDLLSWARGIAKKTVQSAQLKNYIVTIRLIGPHASSLDNASSIAEQLDGPLPEKWGKELISVEEL